MEEPQRKQIESQQGLTIVTSKYAVKCKLCISYIKKSPVKFFCAATSPPFCKAIGALVIPSAGTPRFPSALHSAAWRPTLHSSLAWWSRFFSVLPRHPCAPLTPFTHLSSSSCLILPLDCTPCELGSRLTRFCSSSCWAGSRHSGGVERCICGDSLSCLHSW